MTDDAHKYERLARVATITSGHPLRGSLEALEQGDVHLLQLKHMSTDNDIDWKAVPKVKLPTARNPAWLTDQDVIFASRGTRTLAYSLTNTPARTVCAPQFFVLSINDVGSVLPQFLAWQINQRPAQDYFQRNATGSYIQNIRREVVENLPLALPALQEQRLIVEFWGAAQRERTALINLIENRNNELEALALKLLQSTGATQ
ncbi:MAG: restriction endonuclease subunit S [Pirellulaceae bacterium]